MDRLSEILKTKQFPGVRVSRDISGYDHALGQHVTSKADREKKASAQGKVLCDVDQIIEDSRRKITSERKHWEEIEDRRKQRKLAQYCRTSN